MCSSLKIYQTTIICPIDVQKPTLLVIGIYLGIWLYHWAAVVDVVYGLIQSVQRTQSDDAEYNQEVCF